MSEQLPDVNVWMIHHQLRHAPTFALPPGYRMRFYHEGDTATWVAIQQAAEPYFVPTAETFVSSMPGDAAYLATRVMFLVDPSGAAVGTITAWSGALLGYAAIGQIHWVALLPAVQGRGLAKPMLSAAVNQLLAQGYTNAVLETNTRRVAALNLYLQFGFAPQPQDDAERDAWRRVAPQLKYRIDL